MEFRDLKRQYAVCKEQMDAAMQEICGQTSFISGAKVKELEECLAAYVGRKHCITCASGTDALVLPLKALGIGTGDAVFVPDFTFFASGECVAAVEATPIFVDVEADTYNMDPDSLWAAVEAVKQEGVLTPKAVIAVDLFGQPMNYDAIYKIASASNLLIIEDAAQGFGGKILAGNGHTDDRMACTLGDISATSFFPTKPLGCYGDGGAVFTDDDEVAALIRSYAVHGKGSNKYDNVRIGMNSRLDTLQAAVLMVKLDLLGKELEDINRIADWYFTYLQPAKDLSAKNGKGLVFLPRINRGYYSSWAQFVIQLSDEEMRDKVKNALQESGIPAMIYYPKPMHEQEAFAGTWSAVADNPVTERLCKTVLALPMHPYLTEAEVQQIAETVAAAVI